ncbi:hypothetical protein VC83_00594 [Pseudogymnoascus destructans]|uniref:CRIB domain-containing protein n=2 Tax=Pseudogymnoascus destructans TaxID=655981 RepID=L8G8S3_PSED2|nr:uncharacterized protein VC83_00594 [Pseudogymnoascus destructans]ELR09487.1 hypothetical protein GMDG_00669 [Pseudogymnoascus destructans 20631-21]OAF63092.1 hypothetical protein VC83_00594 [Pseudogymnoascus destructans]
MSLHTTSHLGESNKPIRSPAGSISTSSMTDFPARTMEPAMDGPPSPQRIRAYTEQMKRSVAAGHQRTRTGTSSTSSSASGADSGTRSPEESLSRQASRKSTAGMSVKAERPDTLQMFGKALFSRGSKRSKKGRSRASSLLSLSSRESTMVTPRSAVDEEVAFKKHLISGPYDFQHVVHTGHEQAPNVDIASRDDLLEEFSTVRRSNAPTGELRGIRADDLHFHNFSLEALDVLVEKDPPQPPPQLPLKSPARRSIIRKPPSPLKPSLRSSKSQDSVRAGLSPPPRPPRSPMTAQCPISLPPRTSSRTASIISDEYDPLQSTSLERPHYSAGFRRPQAFHLPRSPPLPSPPLQNVHGDHEVDYFQERTTMLLRSPENEGWPFSAAAQSPSDSKLEDVPEEEETVAAARRSRISIGSTDLRISKSVPNLLPFRARRDSDRPHTPSSDIVRAPVLVMTPKKSDAKLDLDTSRSWEDDIDYCYDHEVEADCDYNWERHSIDVDTVSNYFHDSAISTNSSSDDVTLKNSPPLASLHSASAMEVRRESRRLSAHLDGLRHPPVYNTPSILAPAHTPDLIPPSTATMADSPASTPTPPTRPTQLRSPSAASSFKESFGFTLSPSLLIPADYAAQMNGTASPTSTYSAGPLDDVSPTEREPSPAPTETPDVVSSPTLSTNPFLAYIVTTEKSENLLLQSAEERLLPPSRAPSAFINAHDRKGSVPLLGRVAKESRGRASTIGGSLGRGKGGYGLFPSMLSADP